MRTRTSRLRLLAALLAALLMMSPGCTSAPMLEYNLRVPAQVLLAPGVAPARDGRARFRELFCALLAREPGTVPRPCEVLLHRLSDEPERARQARPLPVHDPGLAVLFVPGRAGGCGYGLPPPFETAVQRLRRLGYDARVAPVNATSNSHANAGRLAREIAEHPSERLVLIGHGRGALDILELLVAHPAAASRVEAVLSVAGAINGSPLADSPAGAALLLPRGGDPACTREERQALEDLGRARRLRWLMEHPLPARTRYFSIGAFAPGPEMAAPLRPRAAALSRIDPRNDGLSLFFDQVLPGAELLGYANADHWSIAAGPAPEEKEVPAFPRDVLIEAAMLRISEALSSGGAGG